MQKLELFVCENAAAEYQAIFENENYEDVSVTVYPCLCLAKGNKQNLVTMLDADERQNRDKVILCSKRCEILKLDSKQLNAYQIAANNYCFQNLANEQLIEYISEHGGYIVSAGWLKNWQRRLREAGFDQNTARQFYQDCCKELVFLDSGIDLGLVAILQDLARYLDIPYKAIKVEIDHTKVALQNIILEWRLHRKNAEFNQQLAELKRQNAEYSAFVHIIQQISVATNKREIITRIIDIFTSIFGAQNCNFADKEHSLLTFGEGVADFVLHSKQKCLISEKDNHFFVKVEYNEELLGIVKADGFLFPQYIRKYAEFAVSLADVCAVVMQNAKQYELLERRKDELKYLSYHDGLTGLYNRTYFNEAIQDFRKMPAWAIFICDIDKMKAINDSYGHPAGDLALRLTAELLRCCFRETDIIARVGGDEFAVLVNGCDAKTARMLKERCLATSARQNETGDFPWHYSLSIGFAIADRANVEVEPILLAADQAMYLDKKIKKTPPV